MGLPEIKLGAVPGYGGTQRLPRHIGESRAMEMILTGNFINADEAERIGLIQRVFEDELIPNAKTFAREFTKYSLPALRFAREATRRALDVSLDEGLKIEADVNTLSFFLEDAKEGTSAFLEKRSATFVDR